MIGFIIGLFIGGVLGVVTMAFLNVSRDNEADWHTKDKNPNPNYQPPRGGGKQ